MKYSSIERAAGIVATEVLAPLRRFGLDNKLPISIKPIKVFENGFVAVRILMGPVTTYMSLDTYANEIKEEKPAIQYLSVRINKLISQAEMF